jgi:hypothetical protein
MIKANLLIIQFVTGFTRCVMTTSYNVMGIIIPRENNRESRSNYIRWFK